MTDQPGTKRGPPSKMNSHDFLFLNRHRRLYPDLFVYIPDERSRTDICAKLTADPVFRMGTILSEFTTIAEGVPEPFITRDVTKMLNDARPMNKVLERLLAGLIPIRAEAVDFEVLVVNGEEYIVYKEAAKEWDGDRRPLVIVGVTEHIAYWKDIRRVLFSDADCRLLCRASRAGLHRSWTPVKLADLFRHVAPDLVDQINNRKPVFARLSNRGASRSQA